MRPPEVERLAGWGGAVHADSLVYRPTDAEGVAAALLDARERALTVAARGGGLSYGDAALNQDGAVIDLGALDGVLDFDPDEGLLRAQAGATVETVWRHAVASGWWPAVVPGSMKATLGGCVAMDVHGKNHVSAGAFGRHVRAVTLMTADGGAHSLRTQEGDTSEAPSPGTSREEAAAPELSDVIGGQGLNGIVLDVTLQLQRVHRGVLDVEVIPCATLGETIAALDQGADAADYAVAWLDCTGARAGRGVVHHARYLAGAREAQGAVGADLDPVAQALPSRIAGVLPARHAWRALRPMTNRAGIRVLNAAKYLAAAFGGRRRYTQTHAAFHFLLDYVPGWKRAYGRPGLVQYQLFAPAASAADAFAEALRAQRRAGLPSFLGVMKRHTRELSAATYAVDGYSLALDFPAGVGSHRRRLQRLVASLEAIRAEAGGRVYAAKDAFGSGILPARRDPAFSSNLVRRWEAGA